jgi:tetratricopeptide (TPR) repeat protein
MTRRLAHSLSKRWLKAGLAISCVLTVGCANRGPLGAGEGASDPSAVAPSAAVAAISPRLAAFEAQQRLALEQATRQGRWGEALWALDVLQALRPTDTSLATRRANAEREAQDAAADRVRQARQLFLKGDSEGAGRLYLEALSLHPQHVEAADALRALERERVARQHLGISSRTAFARNPFPAVKKGGKAPDSGRNDLEHASMMASQGDLKGAIGLLRQIVLGPKPEPGARRLLADLYLREAELLWPTQRAAAITSAENGLKLEPQHKRLRESLSAWREAFRINTDAQPAGPSPRKVANNTKATPQ